MSIELTDEHRPVLGAMMDRLIPPVGDLPGAGALGLFDDVQRMAAAHARYSRALAACLEALAREPSVKAAGGFVALDGEGQDAALRAIEASAPLDFAITLEAVYTAYYSRPEVHKRIGWRTGPLQPAGFTLPPFDESILDTVRRRPQFWRKAPD